MWPVMLDHLKMEIAKLREKNREGSNRELERSTGLTAFLVEVFQGNM